jgi:hypothetical protein
VIDENLLIFDPKEEAEPFFFHGSRQNCRDLQKKQNKEMDFGFDRVFGCDSSNEAVFEGSTKDIVKSLLDGYNCSGEYNSTPCVSFCFIDFFVLIFRSNNISSSLQRLYLQKVIKQVVGSFMNTMKPCLHIYEEKIFMML